MRESFTYLFKDNKWLKIFSIIFIFITAITYNNNFYILHNKNNEFVMPLWFLIPLAIGCLIFYLIITGYKITTIKSFQDQTSNYILPLLNLKSNLKIGFKYICAYYLFSTCCLLIIAIFGLIYGLASTLTDNSCIRFIMAVPLYISLILYVAYMIVSEFAYIYMFAKSPSYMNFFKFAMLFKYIRKNIKTYFIAFCYYLVLCFILAIITKYVNSLSLFSIGLGGKLLLSSVIISIFETYKFFVTNMLVVKSIEHNIIEE